MENEKTEGDYVVESLHEMRTAVREEIKSRYKKTKPFRARKVTKPRLNYGG